MFVLKDDRRALLLALYLLALSAAVFGWGLQYKLSLYHGKDATTQQIPEAKLLSQKERPTADQAITISPVAARIIPVIPIFLFVAAASLLKRAVARYSRIASVERSSPPFPLCLQAIFFRPPPALL